MRSKSLIPVLIFIIGISISVSFFLFSRQAETNQLKSRIKLAGERRYYSLDNELEAHLTILESIASFYKSSEEVTPKEFSVFTSPFLQKHEAVQALEWVPAVLHKDRQAFEKRLKAYFPGFQITERETQGHMIRRRNSAEYFPVTHVEPFKGNESALGFDLSSNSVRKRALIHARRTGETVSTGKIKLVQERQSQHGILVIYPIHSHLPEGMKPKQMSEREFSGFALGVFRIKDLLLKTGTDSGMLDEGIHINLYDRAAYEEDRLLYSETQGITGRSNYEYHKLFTFGGRQWELVAIADQAFIDGQTSFLPLTGLTAGIAISLLVAGYIREQLKNTTKIRKEVHLRTRELQLNELQTRQILDTALNGMITISAKGTISYFNPAAESIFQYTADEVIGRNVKMLMPDPYHSEHDTYLSNYLKTGVKKVIGIGREVTGLRKDGSMFPMRLAVGETGFNDTHSFVGVILDITDQKEAEKQLIFAKETAEDANRMKTEFLNTMSHELRTPLTVILGNITELTDPEYLPQGEEISEIANDIEKAGDHLLVLINDLLDLSKIEAGKMVLHREKLDAGTIVHESANALRKLAENKGLLLVESTKPLFVSADPVRLKQILINLVGNAIKFTLNGEIEIRVEKSGDFVRFAITDSGIGISVEDRKIVFNPFRQVDATSKRVAGGTGLGLAITKKLVELHDGTISLESQPGQGSTFIFTIPSIQETEK